MIHELPEAARRCKVDGQVMPMIRYEVSKQLDYIPAKMQVIVHKRAVYACPEKHDEATLITAPKPPQPIEKGKAAAGLLAQVVLSRLAIIFPATESKTSSRAPACISVAARSTIGLPQ